MKFFKLGAILGIIICCVMGILITLGWVQDETALQSLKKALIVIGIITVGMGAITLISGPKS